MSAPTHPGRRIVAYTDHDGRSKLWAERKPWNVDFETVPGLRAALIWATEDGKIPRGVVADPARGMQSLHPGPGGSTFMMLTVPPDSVYADPAIDLNAVAAEQMRKLPGVADRLEADAPGFHATDTIEDLERGHDESAARITS